MHIVAKGRNGPFVVAEHDGIAIRSLPDFGVAVSFTRDTRKRQMRKTDTLEICYRYKPGTKAIGFHAEGSELHGYHVRPQENRGNTGAVSHDDLDSVWKYCFDTAAGRPFKVFFTFWE